MISFEKLLDGLVSDLSRLTGVKVHNRISSYINPIQQSISRVLYFRNTKDLTKCAEELVPLQMLVKHLKEIEQFDKALLRKFKKEMLAHLRTTNAFDNYFGIRCEINIAASLIRKGVDFKKSESPDFVINRGNLFIECGSTHVSKPKPSSKFKIGSVINQKSKKAYANSKTALFIDITNIIHNELNTNNNTLEDLVVIEKAYIKDVLVNSKFGNVTIFTYRHNRESNYFESTYARIDNNHIDSHLSVFLDEHYPITNQTVGIEKTDIPPNG